MLGVSVVDVSTAPAIVQEKDEAEARFEHDKSHATQTPARSPQGGSNPREEED